MVVHGATGSALTIVLETARLTLGELEFDDIDFVAGMLADPEVMRFYSKPLTLDESVEWIEKQRARYAADGHGLWLATEAQTGRPVGQVGLLTQQVGEQKHPEIGYLIHRPYWRRGFASEAAAAVRDHAFSDLGSPYVISLIRPENVASIGVATKLGMRTTGHVVWAGLDHLLFRLERDGWTGGTAQQRSTAGGKSV